MNAIFIKVEDDAMRRAAEGRTKLGVEGEVSVARGQAAATEEMAQDGTADGPASGGKARGRYGVEVAGEAVVEGVEEGRVSGSTQED